MDTIIPNMPKKSLEEPDDNQYHANIGIIETSIEKINEEIKELKS